jgi:hypothetical protein
MQLKITSAYTKAYTKSDYFTSQKFLWLSQLTESVFVHNLTLSSEKSTATLREKDKNVK